MDRLSLDIQRNRDHGIPSYTQFRKYCGLKDIKNKQDMLEIINPKVLKVYRSWNDIELLTGALFEKHEDDAMVGPTMRCIIREQFIRTRIADRYFYDLPKVFDECKYNCMVCPSILKLCNKYNTVILLLYIIILLYLLKVPHILNKIIKH